MLWLRILRIALYVQLLLGLTRYFGPLVGLVLNQRIWETHISLGVLIVLLALYALRPLPGVGTTGVRVAARFMPLLPLLLGVGFLAQLIPTGPFVILHMVLGLATIALVEVASGQERRALRRREHPALP
jgi:hypothetical protein